MVAYGNGNIPVFRKTGSTSGIKGMLVFVLQLGRPFSKLKDTKKYSCDVKKGVKVWGKYKQFELNCKSQ